MLGWLCCKNCDCTSLLNEGGKIEKSGDCLLYTNLHNKFYKDTIEDAEGYFLEGYILNRQELTESFKESSWGNAYRKMSSTDLFPVQCRGSFCGFYFKTDGDKCFFTDHTGSKAVYYYIKGERLIVSTRLYWVVKVLLDNHIEYRFDEQAAKYMLTYGFMLDDSTFISEVRRLLPGHKIILNGEKFRTVRYYMPSIGHTLDVSEEEAVQMIDRSFRIAVEREFEKDREYGYKHLVDLSGGLDSRMVSWVAHELGYNKQTNFSYCKSGYLDFKISSHIARDLKHAYYYKQLDDFQWMKSIEEILRLNNGEALYSGITGGKEFLENFSEKQYGIEHTGMLGDVIISCFARSEDAAYQKPRFGRNQYSALLNYDFPNDILDQYDNQEIFDVYTRGFLGAMSTYAIRQNYFEVASPFLDVDFLETCFSIPIKYRVKHNLYIKWINKYYKDAAKYGWEKWAGVPPKKNLILVRNGVFVLRKLKRICREMAGCAINDNMNPFEYWYAKDEQIQAFFEQYYSENINKKYYNDALRKDIDKLFKVGTVSEKTQALTVLGMGKLYFDGKFRG